MIEAQKVFRTVKENLVMGIYIYMSPYENKKVFNPSYHKKKLIKDECETPMGVVYSYSIKNTALSPSNKQMTIGY